MQYLQSIISMFFFQKKRNKNIIIFALSLIIYTKLVAQNHFVDDKNHEKALEFSDNDADSLIFYSKKMQDSDNYCRKLTGFFYESNAYYKKGDFN